MSWEARPSRGAAWGPPRYDDDAAEAGPPAKRARTGAAPSRQSTSVYLTNVPVEFSHETLVEMHEAVGLDQATLMASKFLPAGPGSTTCSVILRYRDEATANEAISTLHDQPVASPSGEVMNISARSADKPTERPAETSVEKVGRHGWDDGGGRRGRGWEEKSSNERWDTHSNKNWDGKDDGHWNRWEEDRKGGRKGGLADNARRDERRGGKGGKGGKGGRGGWEDRRGYNREKGGWRDKGNSIGPATIYPSIYVSDIPREYTEDTIREMHVAFGLDEDALMATKFLPLQDSSGETCSAILRYRDDASADKAMNTLRGKPVLLRSGLQKFLGAKSAKPARWMVERGVPDHEEEDGKVRAAPGQISGGRPQTPTGAPPDVAPQLPEVGQIDWCGNYERCTGQVGQMLYADLASGTPFCESCWSAWRSREGL